MTIKRILDECEKRMDHLTDLINDIDEKIIYASGKEKDKLIEQRRILAHERKSLWNMVCAS